MGAVTVEALAISQNTTPAAARGRLQAAVRAGLLTRRRALAERPALYVLSRAGMSRCGLQGLDPCRVSAANAGHLIACAVVAAALERGYPDHRVMGERELRRDERELGVPVASARMGVGSHGESLLHRPDLVLWPAESDAGLPVAVEVELTLKAPRRLADICRAWARCRTVAGVLYVAPPEVGRALERAITRAHAHERIVVVGIDALPCRPREALEEELERSPENTVPSNP
ncbi:MAG TPA: hypothetical protein VNY27_07530 [Solirubrobacteraceae bacterium]|nr:hypothetical protein [Solirubrobacteraceae bacterium]